MKQWEKYDGDIFDTETEAREDAWTDMTWEVWEEELSPLISYHKLFDYARQKEDFFLKFENEFCEAENNYFEEHYSEIDTPDEEEEEE